MGWPWFAHATLQQPFLIGSTCAAHVTCTSRQSQSWFAWTDAFKCVWVCFGVLLVSLTACLPVNQLINRAINQPINQPLNHPFNRSTCWPINQPINLTNGPSISDMFWSARVFTYPHVHPSIYLCDLNVAVELFINTSNDSYFFLFIFSTVDLCFLLQNPSRRLNMFYENLPTFLQSSFDPAMTYSDIFHANNQNRTLTRAARHFSEPLLKKPDHEKNKYWKNELWPQCPAMFRHVFWAMMFRAWNVLARSLWNCVFNIIDAGFRKEIRHRPLPPPGSQADPHSSQTSKIPNPCSVFLFVPAYVDFKFTRHWADNAYTTTGKPNFLGSSNF